MRLFLDSCTCGSLRIKARGLCGKCYERRRLSKSKDCREDDCGNAKFAKGYCRAHYFQVYRNGKVSQARERSGSCSVLGCTRPYRARGLCIQHYNKAVHKVRLGEGPFEYIIHQIKQKNRPSRIKQLKERYELMKRNKVREEKRLEYLAGKYTRDADPWGREEDDPSVHEDGPLEIEHMSQEEDC